LGEDWQLLRKFYKENSSGPAKFEVSERFGFSKYLEDAEALAYSLKQQSD
jgi:hypothetical protein